MTDPAIIAETPSYVVVDKPHNMHTAPLRENEDGTLLDWCARRYPEARTVRGRKPVEGGLLHRLDFETAGLVLVARTQAAYDFFSAEQAAGHFEKEYTARTRRTPSSTDEAESTAVRAPVAPFVIKSGFRHYGPGRKRVKPEFYGDSPAYPSRIYATMILDTRETGGDTVFRIRLTQGFRHQIRTHLAWAGYPINNDALYGGAQTGGSLALTAYALLFPDPEDSTVRCCYRKEGENDFPPGARFPAFIT
jgi:23S rRNA pseudouridine1911/1915/1917 synthase